MTFSGKREKFMKTAPAVPEKCSFKKIGLMPRCPVLQKNKGLLQNLTRYATALFLLNLSKIVYNKAMIRR